MASLLAPEPSPPLVGFRPRPALAALLMGPNRVRLRL